MARVTPRQLLAAVAITAVGAGAYAGLRASSVFSVESIEVNGASPDVRAQIVSEVRGAVGGESMLAIDPDAVARRLEGLPTVQDVRVDRAFPHRLTVDVVPEVPVALAPAGGQRAVVGRSGRVLALVAPGAAPKLPVLAAAPVEVPTTGRRVGAPLVRDEIAVAAATLTWRGGRVSSVRYTSDGLVARMRQGYDLRLGDADDLPAKLDAAWTVTRAIGADGRSQLLYVDVSAPTSPVVRTIAGNPATAEPDTLGEDLVGAADATSTDAAATTASDAGNGADTGATDGSTDTEGWAVPSDPSAAIADIFGAPKS